MQDTEGAVPTPQAVEPRDLADTDAGAAAGLGHGAAQRADHRIHLGPVRCIWQGGERQQGGVQFRMAQAQWAPGRGHHGTAQRVVQQHRQGHAANHAGRPQQHHAHTHLAYGILSPIVAVQGVGGRADMLSPDPASPRIFPMTDQPDHRPAPGTALGPPARVHAVPDDGRGDRVVLQGGTAVALQQLFAGADAPEPLLAAFANGMATLPGELGDMGDRLQSAQASADWPRYGRAMRQLIDKYIRTIAHHSPDGQPDSQSLSEQLRLPLGGAVVSLLLHAPDMREKAQALAAQLRQ